MIGPIWSIDIRNQRDSDPIRSVWIEEIPAGKYILEKKFPTRRIPTSYTLPTSRVHIICNYWYHALLLASWMIAGNACYYWASRVIADIMIASITGHCEHRLLLLTSFRVIGFSENPDRFFVGKFICQSRPDRDLLKQESVPNRVPNTIYRSQLDHRPELYFW